VTHRGPCQPPPVCESVAAVSSDVANEDCLRDTDSQHGSPPVIGPQWTVHSSHRYRLFLRERYRIFKLTAKLSVSTLKSKILSYGNDGQIKAPLQYYICMVSSASLTQSSTLRAQPSWSNQIKRKSGQESFVYKFPSLSCACIFWLVFTSAVM